MNELNPIELDNTADYSHLTSNAFELYEDETAYQGLEEIQEAGLGGRCESFNLEAF